MLNNQIHRDKRLDNLKGIDSEKASARAAKRRETEEFFLLQHIIVFLGAFMITYFLVIGILENAEKVKGFSGLFLGLLFTAITFVFARLTIFEFFYSIKKLIFFLAEYVSIFKVIMHTAAISALATALSFFVNSEFAANYLRSIGPEGPQIINNYYMLPVITYFLFFAAVGFYYLFGQSNSEDKNEHTN